MATEIGSINRNREPVIAVRISENIAVDCVVDTGFSGALMLPNEIIGRSKIRLIGKERFQLVSGNSIIASLALLEVDWLGQKRLVRVVISEGSDALIGAELLDRSRLVIDYLTDQVTLTSREE